MDDDGAADACERVSLMMREAGGGEVALVGRAGGSAILSRE